MTSLKFSKRNRLHRPLGGMLRV